MMLRISDALKHDLSPYVNYRFSHLTKAERRLRIKKIISILKQKDKDRQDKFHADILRFMDVNSEGIGRLKEINDSPDSLGLDVKSLCSQREKAWAGNPELMKHLILKNNGDLVIVLKEFQRVSNNQFYQG